MILQDAQALTLRTWEYVSLCEKKKDIADVTKLKVLR